MGRLTVDQGLYLRLLEKSDAEALHALIEANRSALQPWLSWAATQTFEDTVSFIQRAGEQLHRNEGFQAAVVCGGELAGVAGFHTVDWANRSTTLGYWLDRRQQGRGMMTAAVRRLTDHAISAWELNRVEIRVAVENHRSKAIPERLGFHREGVLLEAEHVCGRYLDAAVYSMLRRRWTS